jgi:hypothetical protein
MSAALSLKARALVLALGLVGVLPAVSGTVAQRARWHVHPGQSIQAALAAAQPGQTVEVAAESSRPTDYRALIGKLTTAIPALMKTGGTVGLTIALVDGNRTVWLRGFC